MATSGVGTFFKQKNDAETSLLKIQGIRATGQTSLLLSDHTAGIRADHPRVLPNSSP